MKIKVNDMHCQSCSGKIQRLLLSNGIVAKVDGLNKLVFVDEEGDRAIEIIKEAGYNPEAQ